MGEVARPGLKLPTGLLGEAEMPGGMGEVARPGLKLYLLLNADNGGVGGMGEVARPGLKRPAVQRSDFPVLRWNGRGGPSGFETNVPGFLGIVEAVVEWERWPVRV